MSKKTINVALLNQRVHDLPPVGIVALFEGSFGSDTVRKALTKRQIITEDDLLLRLKGLLKEQTSDNGFGLDPIFDTEPIQNSINKINAVIDMYQPYWKRGALSPLDSQPANKHDFQVVLGDLVNLTSKKTKASDVLNDL